MIPFIYRLLTQPIALPDDTMAPGLNRDSARQRCELMRRSLGKVPVLCLDNVASMYASSPKQEWDLREIPNMAPPWSWFFVEWNQPREFNIGGQLQSTPAGQVGVFVLALRVDRSADCFAELMQVWSGVIGAGTSVNADTLVDPATSDIIRQWLDTAKWVLMTDVFFTLSGPPLNGQPLWNGLHHFVTVNADGRYIGHNASGVSVASMHRIDSQFIGSLLTIIALGLSFTHCKNVTSVSATAGIPSDKWHRRTKTPKVRYYVLAIDHLRQILKRDGQLETNGLGVALHICRGNFAHYTADNPLFGKYEGTFWRPAHVRGNEKRGRVLKDYSVK